MKYIVLLIALFPLTALAQTSPYRDIFTGESIVDELPQAPSISPDTERALRNSLNAQAEASRAAADYYRERAVIEQANHFRAVDNPTSEIILRANQNNLQNIQRLRDNR